MRNYMAKFWMCFILLASAVSSLSAEELWIRDFSARFKELESNLIRNGWATSQLIDKYDNGECRIYDFSVSKNVLDDKIVPFYQYLHKISENCTQYIDADDLPSKSSPKSIRYGRKDEKQISFKGSDHYAIHGLQEYNDNNRKHFFAIKWQNKGGKAVGSLFFILKVTPDFSKSMEGVPQNASNVLMQLSNYRILLLKLNKENYNEEQKLAAQTSIVNQIFKLCEQDGKLLDKDEKRLGKNLLSNMRAEVSDSFLNGMLELAIKKLK